MCCIMFFGLFFQIEMFRAFDRAFGCKLRWFKAEDHMVSLTQFVKETVATVDPTLHCVDIFGASKKIMNTWISHHYSAQAYDIKLDRRHDITSQCGFRMLLKMLLKLPGV